jgi:hypothetical protein
MSVLRRWLLWCVWCVCLACHQEEVRPAPQPPVAANSGDAFLGGVAVADITPPLHLALYGHGPEGGVATGVRLRLRCQVFVLASRGKLVVMIPCDLQGPSRALHYGIADRLRSYGLLVSADQIFLMATHTHAGPAHYFEANRYSGPFSSRTPGYDEKVVDFLVRRVADAAAQAIASLTPVCVGYEKKPLRGLSFNRAYAAYLSNEQANFDGKLAQHQVDQAREADLSTSSDPRSEAASGPETAVDASLFVLRLDKRAPGAAACAAEVPPLGVMAVFGVHPTGVPNTNDLYHGDIFGFATRTAATCLRRAQPRSGRAAGSTQLAWPDDACDALDGAAQPSGPAEPEAGRNDPAANVVVGLANGVEGDVSPRVDFQSFHTARLLGRKLGIARDRKPSRWYHDARRPWPDRAFLSRAPLPERPLRRRRP